MIGDLPKFERLPLNPQSEEEKEIFYPKWNCFCCQDKGFVQAHLAKLIIIDYDYNQDRNIACQNPSCGKFKEIWDQIDIANFDTRFLPAICQKLDFFSREDWRKTVQRQVDIRSLAKTMAMPGVPDRTDNENREIQERKKEVENFDWEAASTAYLGSE